MDQGTLQGIGTILAMLAFLGICWWAFSKHKKQDFEEASRLPFDEGELQEEADLKGKADLKEEEATEDGDAGTGRNKRQD